MTPSRPPVRLRVEAGIAIGPILFVIAALGLIATMISSNIGSYSSAGAIDRTAAELPSQANLIRTRMNQCNIQLASQLAIQNNNVGVPVPGNCSRVADCAKDPATFVGVTAVPTPVASVTCNGANLWQGLAYPQPSMGFAAWNYVGNTTGGRCIYTAPTTASPATNNRVVEAMKLVTKKFSTQTTCNNTSTPCTGEALYDPAAAAQKFVVWIGMPDSGVAPDPLCLP